MVNRQLTDSEIRANVRRVAVPLLTIRVYLTQRSYEPPITVAELVNATGISEPIVRDVIRALLANGFPAQVYDGVWIAPQSFESEAAS